MAWPCGYCFAASVASVSRVGEYVSRTPSVSSPVGEYIGPPEVLGLWSEGLYEGEEGE